MNPFLTVRTGRVRARSGFTMVEVLVALSLLTLAILGVMGLLQIVSSTSKDTQQTSQAMYAAQEKMDDILRQNVLVSTQPTSDVPSSMPNATRTWVGAADPLGNSSIQIVTVTVTWTEGKRQRSISLRSAVST